MSHVYIKVDLNILYMWSHTNELYVVYNQWRNFSFNSDLEAKSKPTLFICSPLTIHISHGENVNVGAWKMTCPLISAKG